MRTILRAAALAASLLPAMPAGAQEDWPTRPVTIVIPATPGAGTDLFARLLAEALSASLKQQFLVENKAGAGGNIAAVAVARSTPNRVLKNLSNDHDDAMS